MKDLIVSFSGGRTSAYMAKWLLDNKSSVYNLIFIFANTGLEHEKTLEFVDRCDREWGLNLIWVEAVTHREHGKGCTSKVVSYETASRNGEPFHEMTAWYGLAGVGWTHCNRELKLNPMRHWASVNGYSKCYWAIGIRSDEVDRISPTAKEKRIIYPLVSQKMTTKPEIMHWWRDQDFDLEISEHLGNCVTCWKKSDRKLFTIAKHEPIRFIHFQKMEEEHCRTGSSIDKTDHGRRFFFRRHRTVSDILEAGKGDFVEFEESFPEWQQDFFGLDQNGGCGESCDIFADE